jgi:ribosomal protein L29
MGQSESLKKIRGLRKDIARIKTVQRAKSLAAAKTGTEKK